MMKNRFNIPKTKKIKYESFLNKNGSLDDYFQPAIFCDTSFLFDYWMSDSHNPSYLKLVDSFEPVKHKFLEFYDPHRRTKKLFELRKIIDNLETDYNFIYSPACRYELEEIFTRNNFKFFVSENYDTHVVERKNNKEIGKIIKKIKIDAFKNLQKPDEILQQLFFGFLQTTSGINNGLPGFIEPDIVNFKFSKKDFYKMHLLANQQMGFADLFHLISANRLGCKYFFTFDSDFETCKDDIAELFDMNILTDINEMIKLIKK